MPFSGDLNADSICTRSNGHESGKQTSKMIIVFGESIEGFNFQCVLFTR